MLSANLFLVHFLFKNLRYSCTFHFLPNSKQTQYFRFFGQNIGLKLDENYVYPVYQMIEVEYRAL